MDESDYELSLPPPLPPRQCTCTCTCAASRNNSYSTVNFENSIAEFVNNSIKVGNKVSQSNNVSNDNQNTSVDYRNRSVDYGESPRVYRRKSMDYNNKTMIYHQDSFDQDPIRYICNNWVDLENDNINSARNSSHNIQGYTSEVGCQHKGIYPVNITIVAQNSLIQWFCTLRST